MTEALHLGDQPTTVYGQWNNIFICHEKLRLSVFKVNKIRSSAFAKDETQQLNLAFIFASSDCSPSAHGMPSRTIVHASAPETFNEDPPSLVFNARMFRVLMSPDMYFYPGWQYLAANATSNSLGSPLFINGQEMTTRLNKNNGPNPWVYTLTDLYREYCRYDFGKFVIVSK